MNRRELCSLVIAPLLPAKLRADSEKRHQLYIEGFGKVTGKKCLVFKLDAGSYAIDFNIGTILRKIFPNDQYGNLTVVYLNIANIPENINEYNEFIRTGDYHIIYSVKAETLRLMTLTTSTIYNKKGIRIK